MTVDHNLRNMSINVCLFYWKSSGISFGLESLLGLSNLNFKMLTHIFVDVHSLHTLSYVSGLGLSLMPSWPG